MTCHALPIDKQSASDKNAWASNIIGIFLKCAYKIYSHEGIKVFREGGVCYKLRSLASININLSGFLMS